MHFISQRELLGSDTSFTKVIIYILVIVWYTNTIHIIIQHFDDKFSKKSKSLPDSPTDPSKHQSYSTLPIVN